MVKVEIVDEKEESNSPYASSSSSRTNSTDSVNSIQSEPDSETFFERIAALVDIVPPTTRYSIASNASKAFSTVKRIGKIAGNVVWIVTTSALLVGLPLALSIEDEQKLTAQEKEMLAQQQGAQQVRIIIPLSRSLDRSIHLFSCALLSSVLFSSWVHTPLLDQTPTSNSQASSRQVSDHPFFFLLHYPSSLRSV